MTMIKEFTITVFIIVFFSACIYYIANQSRPLQYRTEKVVIDSVSVKNDYSFLLDKTWTYYTKYGATVSSKNNQIFNVGDSIEVKIIKVNQ